MPWSIRRHTRGRPPHPDVLTPAEWRVLDGIRKGRANQEIADHLDVSVNTVRTHVSSMLAKLELPDRRALAEWDGQPAPATSKALDRFGLLAPFLGQWVRLAASGTAVAVAIGVLGVALDGGRGDAGGAPEVTATASATEPGEPEATPTAVAAPYEVTFASGEPVDVSPAVLFIEPETGAVSAWVFPADVAGEFGVAPDGSFIVFRRGDRIDTLNTETGEVHPTDLVDLPVEYGPQGMGFIGNTGGLVSVMAPDGGLVAGFGQWRAADRAVTAAWSPDGRAVAISQNKDGTKASLAIWRLGEPTVEIPPMAPDGRVQNIDVPQDTHVALRWSNDGSRLAFLVRGHLRVFSEDGALLWEREGAFGWNPRWSPDDAHIYLSNVAGRETAMVFTSEGEPVLRIQAGYAGGCAGPVWLDARTFAYGGYRVDVDGQVSELPRHRDLYLDLASLGVVLAPSVDGFHQLHFGVDNYRLRLDDGRYVISTPEWGHGGCAEGVSGGLDDSPRIEFPPFED